MWFRSQLSDLAEKTEASLFFEFKPFHMYQLCRALEAPICQFVGFITEYPERGDGKKDD